VTPIYYAQRNEKQNSRRRHRQTLGGWGWGGAWISLLHTTGGRAAGEDAGVKMVGVVKLRYKCCEKKDGRQNLSLSLSPPLPSPPHEASWPLPLYKGYKEGYLETSPLPPPLSSVKTYAAIQDGQEAVACSARLQV
jgi:hypothetical protein